ncbi:uncharacterized protein LOC144133552 isoform X3 [Amblyomma americanum]
MKPNFPVLTTSLFLSIANCVSSGGLKSRGVYLTVSSYEGALQKAGHFEINWYGVDASLKNDTFAAVLRRSFGLITAAVQTREHRLPDIVKKIPSASAAALALVTRISCVLGSKSTQKGLPLL